MTFTPIIERITLVQRIFFFAFKERRQLLSLPQVTSSWAETFFFYGAETFLEQAITSGNKDFKLTEKRILFAAATKLSSRYLQPLIEMFWRRPPPPQQETSEKPQAMKKFAWHADSRDLKGRQDWHALTSGNLFTVTHGHEQLSLIQAIVQNEKYNNEIFSDFFLDFLKTNIDAIIDLSADPQICREPHKLEPDTPNTDLQDEKLLNLLLFAIDRHPKANSESHNIKISMQDKSGMFLLGLAARHNCVELVRYLVEKRLQRFCKHNKDGKSANIPTVTQHGVEIPISDLIDLMQLQALNEAILNNNLEIFKLLLTFNHELLVNENTWICRNESKYRLNSYSRGATSLQMAWRWVTVPGSFGLPKFKPFSRAINRVCRDNWIHMLCEHGRLDFLQHIIDVVSDENQDGGTGVLAQRLFVAASATQQRFIGTHSINKMTPLAKSLSSTVLDSKKKFEVANFIISKIKMVKRKESPTSSPFFSAFVCDEFSCSRVAAGRDSPIHFACRSDDVDLLRLILEPTNFACLSNSDTQYDEAKLNQRYRFVLSLANSFGYTPLMICAASGSVNCARFLLENFSTLKSSDSQQELIDLEALSLWTQLSAVQIAILRSSGSDKNSNHQIVKEMIVDSLMNSSSTRERLQKHVTHSVAAGKNNNSDNAIFLSSLRQKLALPPAPQQPVGHRKYQQNLLFHLLKQRDITGIMNLFNVFPDGHRSILTCNRAGETPLVWVIRYYDKYKTMSRRTRDLFSSSLVQRIKLVQIIMDKEKEVRGVDGLQKLVNTEVWEASKSALHAAAELMCQKGEDRSEIEKIIELLVKAGANKQKQLACRMSRLTDDGKQSNLMTATELAVALLKSSNFPGWEKKNRERAVNAAMAVTGRY